MLLALFVTAAAAQQACYYAAGQKAASNIVPCALGSGVASCCQIGDFCLEESACYNEASDLSYLYGCTDPTYTDRRCPWKCGTNFTGAPYVGLKHCHNSTQDDWICSSPPSNDSSIVDSKYPPPECLGDQIIAFAGPTTLPAIASLPSQVGGTTLWISSFNSTAFHSVHNWTPSTLPTPSASEPVSVEYLSNPPTSTPTPTASSGSSSPVPNGLSSGAKIGIGVGVGVGLPLIAAALATGFLILRKRKSVSKDPEELPIAGPNPEEKRRNLSELSPDGRSSVFAELSPEGKDSDPLELPGDQVEAELSATKSPNMSEIGDDSKVHELPGDGPG